jgi:hypothetical protein
MQSIYAMHQNAQIIWKRRKVSFHSIDNSGFIPYNDFFLNGICKRRLSFLHKSSLKHLAAERKPNEKFIKTHFSKSLLKTIL